MANIKSQIKRTKTNEKRRLLNRGVRSEVRTFMKKFDQAVDSGDKDAAVAALSEAGRKLDKAASKGVVHPNHAANKKSSMAKRLNAAG